MAEPSTSIIDLDPLILNRLQQSSAGQAATAAIPTPAPQGPRVAPEGLPTIGVGMAGEGMTYEEMFGEGEKPLSQLVQESGVLNEGAPVGLRFDLSTGTVFDPDLQTKNVEYNLKRYFKEEGLINDDYDFGVRVGPVSQRLEFRDPRYQGKYNVLDAFGMGDIAGDIADISVDTLLPIATEVTAGVGTTLIPGVGQVPLAPILAASTAAYVTAMGRLKYAQSEGLLDPSITDEEINLQAMKEAGYSAAFGVGGEMAFKIARPVIRAMGLASPKMAFNINEDVFLRAFERYMASDAGKKSAELGITPSSAQILEAAGQSTALSPVARGKSYAAAEELAYLEEGIARAPSTERAEAVLTPLREREIKAEQALVGAVEKEMPAGVAAMPTSELAAQQLGEGIQTTLQTGADIARARVQQTADEAISNIESALDDAINMPATVASPREVGAAAQEAVSKSYDDVSASFGKRYEDVFQRWQDSTGVSVDSVIVGKGGIKPSEAAKLASDIRKTFVDRPFLNDAERNVVNKVYNAFVESESGAALKVKPVSLRTINENLRDLRRLERQAYKKALSGEDAPYPETLSAMVDALEKARARVLSRKGAPEGLADELRLIDDDFADFSRRFRNTQLSAVAKLRTAKNPEAAFNLVIQPDRRGASAVEDISTELLRPENAELKGVVRDTLVDMWRSKVVKTTSKGERTFDLGAHNRFLDEYGTSLNTYLSPEEIASLGSARDFSEQLIQAQATRDTALKQIEKDLNLGGGTLDRPEKVFESTWQKGEITPFQKVDLALRQDPSLRNRYKAFVYKDLFSPNNTQVINGREIIDPKKIRQYLDDHGSKMEQLFGTDYVNNLRTVTDVVEIALKEVPKRGRREQANMLTNLVRSYVGLFTRPGRFLTAFNKVRGSVREDAMSAALADPRVMAEMAKASKRSPVVKELDREIGRIFGREYKIPTDEELKVSKGARAILEDLERRSVAPSAP